MYKSTERNYIVLTFPLTNYSLSEIKEYAYLTKEDKVFILSKGGYLYGELSLDKIDDFFGNLWTFSRFDELFRIKQNFEIIFLNGNLNYTVNGTI